MVKAEFPLTPKAAIPLLEVIRLDNHELQPFYNNNGIIYITLLESGATFSGQV